MAVIKGASVTFTASDDTAVARLQEIASGQGLDTTTLMKRLGTYFEESTHRRFDSTQTDPQGEKWKPLSPGYIKRKKKNEDRILWLNSYLRNSVHMDEPTRDTVVWGSNSVYAAIHNLGGNGTGKNGSMPQRQFLGISAADEAEALDIARDWLHRKIHGLPD